MSFISSLFCSCGPLAQISYLLNDGLDQLTEITYSGMQGDARPGRGSGPLAELDGKHHGRK